MALYNENHNRIRTLKVDDDGRLTEHVYERFVYPDGINVGHRVRATIGTEVDDALSADLDAGPIEPGDGGRVV